MLPPSHGHALSGLALNELRSMSPELPGLLASEVSDSADKRRGSDAAVLVAFDLIEQARSAPFVD